MVTTNEIREMRRMARELRYELDMAPAHSTARAWELSKKLERKLDELEA